MSEHVLSPVPAGGDIVPVVWLTFRMPVGSGAYPGASSDFLRPIVNECVYEWDMVANTGAQAFHLVRKARCPKQVDPAGVKAGRFFSDSLRTYLMPKMAADAYNRIAAAAAGTLTVTITVKIWYHKLFYKLLEWYARDTPDSFNFANPGDAKPITSTFKKQPTGAYGFEFAAKELKDIPCVVKEVPGGLVPRGSRPPLKKLAVYLKVKEATGALGFTDQKKAEIVRVIAAADYTKLNRFGRRGADNADLRDWSWNVGMYMRNYTNYDRGERLFDQIVAKGKTAAAGGSQLDVIRVVRNEIDKYLITCNHWSQAREDPVKESYQFELSKLLGGISNKSWPAPIGLYRYRVLRLTSLDTDEEAAFILQMGLAHCGEHANVSFAILRRIMQEGYASLLGTIVNSGQSNVDHDFVLGGFRPLKVIRTRAGPHNKRVQPGSLLKVWNLSAALAAAGAGVNGFICDPYLEQFRGDARIQIMTARNLLRVIKRGGTVYVAWDDIYPPPDPPVEVKPSVPGV